MMRQWVGANDVGTDEGIQIHGCSDSYWDCLSTHPVVGTPSLISIVKCIPMGFTLQPSTS